jgi:hypothetical protein
MLEEQNKTLLLTAELKFLTYIFIYIIRRSKHQNQWNIVAHTQLQYADRLNPDDLWLQ